MVSALLVLVALSLLSSRLWGAAGPTDWFGYQAIYDEGGGYLARLGHDPLFVWLVRRARGIFGGNGYEQFRVALFAAFAGVAGFIAYRIPTSAFGILTTAVIVVEAFFLKSAVQIREGIAWICILLPLVVVFRARRGGMMGSGVGSVLAAFLHAGTSVFGVTWLVAAAVMLSPPWALSGVWPKRAFLAVGVAIGAALAVMILNHGRIVEFWLEDAGNSLSEDVQSGLWKTVYWTFRGAFVLIIRRQLIAAVKDWRHFGYAYATILGSLVIPTVYTLAMILTVEDFYLPAFTSMIIRLLFTVMQTGLLIIALRGRANLLTFLVAVVSLADQFRVFLAV